MNHDFSQSYQEHIEPFSTQGAEAKHERELELERVISSGLVEEEALN